MPVALMRMSSSAGPWRRALSVQKTLSQEGESLGEAFYDVVTWDFHPEIRAVDYSARFSPPVDFKCSDRPYK